MGDDSNRIIVAVTGANRCVAATLVRASQRLVATGAHLLLTFPPFIYDFDSIASQSGLGYGYCQRLLRQLSTAPPAPPPDTRLHPRNVPQPANPSDSRFSHDDVVQEPPSLTLIMACRSRSKAEQAIKSLLHEHDLGLTGRRVRGERERPGWKEGLRVVFEELDVDKVNGKGGVLDFAERTRNK